MSITRPDWPHSAVQVLAGINRLVMDRLNADPTQALWKVETGQLNLSKPGSLRIIWSILGGPISRGWQTQGPDLPAHCRGIRKCRLQAEIRTNQTGQPGVSAVGITPDTLQKAEEVLRALVLAWDALRPGDFDEQEQSEDWTPYTEDPGQREIVCRYQMTIQLLVLDDPRLEKTINQVDSTGVVVQP